MFAHLYTPTHIYTASIVRRVIQPKNYFSMNACISGEDLSGPLLLGLCQKKSLNGNKISARMYVDNNTKTNFQKTLEEREFFSPF